MGDSSAIREARTHLERALDLLSTNDQPEAVLQLQMVRDNLESISGPPPKEEVHKNHDWLVIDPYRAQCRICGRSKPLEVEERMIPTP